MLQSPGNNEIKMLKVLNAWKTLAPSKSFGGMKLEEYENQVNNSIQPRQRLIALDDEIKQQQAVRDDQDQKTLTDIQFIVNGVLADPTEGANSALYEAMGYIRKSARKSGLTRKKVKPAEAAL